MKPKSMRVILSLLMLMSVAVFLWSQGNGMQNRQRVRENLATLRLLRLTQALDLTEEQAAKIFPTVNRVEKEKLNIQRNMSADLRDLRQLVQNEPLKEAEISVKTKSLNDSRRHMRQKEDELEEYLERNLTTVQKAKYLLFQVEFYRIIEQSLDRMRIMRTSPPPAPIKKGG